MMTGSFHGVPYFGLDILNSFRHPTLLRSFCFSGLGDFFAFAAPCSHGGLLPQQGFVFGSCDGCRDVSTLRALVVPYAGGRPLLGSTKCKAPQTQAQIWGVLKLVGFLLVSLLNPKNGNPHKKTDPFGLGRAKLVPGWQKDPFSDRRRRLPLGPFFDRQKCWRFFRWRQWRRASTTSPTRCG